MEIAVTGGLGRLDAMWCADWRSTAVRVLDIGARSRLSPGRSARPRRAARRSARRRGRGASWRHRPVGRHRRCGDHAGQRDGHLEPVRGKPADAACAASIHCSSSSVLGLDHSNPTYAAELSADRRGASARPTDAYGLSKLCGERIAEAYSRRGMEVIVIRPCFVAFPDMAAFMAGKAGPEGRSEPMPYLRTYVGPGGLRPRFRCRGDGCVCRLRDILSRRRRCVRRPNRPSARLESPVRDADSAARCRAVSAASAARHRSATRRRKHRLGWTPTTRWTAGAINA